MCSGRGDEPLRSIRLPYSEIPGYVWLPTNRGLSQAPTSFFGSWCQGIHRVPLSTWQLQMMLASTVQFSRYGRSRSCRALKGGKVPVRAEEVANATVPSGPNSVLGLLVSRTGVPCRQAAVLTR